MSQPVPSISYSTKDNDGQARMPSLGQEGEKRKWKKLNKQILLLASHVEPISLWSRLQNPAGYNPAPPGLLEAWPKLDIFCSNSKQHSSRIFSPCL